MRQKEIKIYKYLLNLIRSLILLSMRVGSKQKNNLQNKKENISPKLLFLINQIKKDINQCKIILEMIKSKLLLMSKKKTKLNNLSNVY